jgi:hypothetical protein
LRAPPKDPERGVGIDLVGHHQHALGLVDDFAVRDDHLQFVGHGLLQFGVQRFGDVDVEAAGRQVRPASSVTASPTTTTLRSSPVVVWMR